MSNPARALWFGLTLALLALPSRAGDDLYTTQIVEQARLWQHKNRDDLAANLWRKVLVVEPRHPEALMNLGAIEARAGKLASTAAPEAPQKVGPTVAPASTAATRERPQRIDVLPEPPAKDATAPRLPSSQAKKSRPASAAKLSNSTGQALDGTETKKPKAAGDNDLNFSTTLAPGQAKPRP